MKNNSKLSDGNAGAGGRGKYQALPKGWQCMKLGDICDIRRGGSPRPIQEYLTKENGINWLRIGDIRPNQKYIYKTKDKITEKGCKKSVLVKKGDFILSNSMSYGRPYIMQTQACIHDGWLSLRNLKKSISKEYLYYFLLTDKTQNRFKSISAGSGVRNLKIESVYGLIVDIPPIPEQKAIVSILETWDTAIEKTEHLIAAKEKHFKWLLKQVMKNQISKEVKKLSETCHCYQPKTISKSNTSDEGKYKVYGANGVIGYYNSYNHKEEQVALTCRGATCGCINFTDKKSWITGNAMVIKPLHDNLDKKFLYYFLLGANFNPFITGMAQPQITRSVIEKMEISFSPLSEQQIIVHKLNTARCEIDLLQSIAEKYRTQKRGLMQKLLKGA